MSQFTEPALIGVLEKAKGQMMESIQTAGQAGRWDRAQWMMEKAKSLDEMIHELRQNGSGHAPLRAAPARATAPQPKYDKLPYYFTESNRLVKIGPSRDGSTYQHRVTRDHFDAMIDKLADIAAKAKTFESPDLINPLDIPKHEPLIILALLEEQKLLINVRRGRWVFTNAEAFRQEAQNVWSKLPRE